MPRCWPPARIAVGALGAAAPANADAGGPWVVIAYSPVNGIHGWANNRDTYKQAYDDALAYCISSAAARAATLGAYSHNQCAAVAADIGNDWGKMGRQGRCGPPGRRGRGRVREWRRPDRLVALRNR